MGMRMPWPVCGQGWWGRGGGRREGRQVGGPGRSQLMRPGCRSIGAQHLVPPSLAATHLGVHPCSAGAVRPGPGLLEAGALRGAVAQAVVLDQGGLGCHRQAAVGRNDCVRVGTHRVSFVQLRSHAELVGAELTAGRGGATSERDGGGAGRAVHALLLASWPALPAAAAHRVLGS